MAPPVTSRRVILVSPYFPPSTLAGVHRVRHLAKYLPEFGWLPTVLCVDDRQYTEPLDPALAALVPASVEIIKTSALPAPLMRLLGIGDIGLRGWFGLKSQLGQLMTKQKPDVVFITGFPFYPLLLAPWIKRRFGVPVVLDFQDPWVSAWGATRPALSKARMAHRLACALEPKALKAAHFVTSVSDTQNAEMAARYPWLDAARMAGIPIGGDRGDFANLQGAAGTSTYLAPNRLNLSYVGTCLPRSIPLLDLFFDALARFRDATPDLAKTLRLNFVGTSNQPGAVADYQVRPLAEKAGVNDLVHEVPQRVAFLEALGILGGSDALLLIGSDEPHYTASKIYPALHSGRPFISLFHNRSSAHDILTRAGGGRAYGFGNANELAALKDDLVIALEDLCAGRLSAKGRDESVVEPFTAQSIAGRFGAVFDQVASAT